MARARLSFLTSAFRKKSTRLEAGYVVPYAKGIEIGIITTPPERAQRAADHLVEAGVCGILNFAGARIHVPEKVVVEYVDFFHYLYALAFSITGSEHRSK